jgi:hypothetical protein
MSRCSALPDGLYVRAQLLVCPECAGWCGIARFRFVIILSGLRFASAPIILLAYYVVRIIVDR